MTAVGSPPLADELAVAVRAAAGGDRAAFGRLYEQYGQAVYNLVLRSVRDPQAAQDVCQEVWVKAYQQLGRLREPAAFPTWLYRIASRMCVDRARRRAALPVTTELSDIALPSRDGDPAAEALRREEARLAWEALGALPTRQHLALFLREVEGQSYQEIASVLGTSHSAIETLLFRARRGLARAYERLQGAMPERCGRAQQAMAVVLDGEATPVQQRAVAAHVDQCLACRAQLRQLRQASASYAALPLLPLPALLAERVGEAVAGAAVGGGIGGGALAKVLGLVAAKGKLVAATATLTGGLTLATLATPSDGPTVTSSAALADRPQEAGRTETARAQTSDEEAAGPLFATGLSDATSEVDPAAVGVLLASVSHGLLDAADALTQEVIERGVIDLLDPAAQEVPDITDVDDVPVDLPVDVSVDEPVDEPALPTFPLPVAPPGGLAEPLPTVSPDDLIGPLPPSLP